MLVKRRCHIFELLCVLLGFSSTSIAPAAQTTPTPTPIISVARTVSADTAFGDGVSVGYLLSSPTDSFPSLLGAALGTTTTVRGFAGGQSCDVPKAQVFHTENPGEAANPIYALLIGSDDVLHGGPEPEYEAVAGLCRKAAITWLTTSSKSKYTGASFPTLPVGWTFEYSYAPNVVGLRSTTNGSVATWTVTTTGGPIALWYRIIDGNGGTFTYSVDGGPAVPVSNSTVPPVNTVNGETDSVGVAIITGVSGSALNPVTHTVSTSVTSVTGATNLVGILGVGTTPPAGALNPPYVWESGQIMLGGDADSALTAAYNADIMAETAELSALGFGVTFVDVRAYYFATKAEMVDWVHPNELGHEHIFDAFYNSIAAVDGNLLPAETVTISDAIPGATIYYTTDGTTPTTSSPVYSGPITLFKTTTVQAVAIASGDTVSSVASATGTVTPLAAKPVFSVAGGTYNTAQTISISDGTPGATIFYTTDETLPTAASAVYSSPIAVSSNTTLKAVAMAGGHAPSIMAYASYGIITPAAAPTFSIPPGTYGPGQVVMLADTTPNAAIYYTGDGSTPTTSSSLYSGPITLSSTETINAIATASGYSSSSVATATFAIAPPAAPPFFNLAGGTYSTPQTLTLTDSTANATIYFTTNATTPTIASTVYTAPITINSTETVEAVAIAPGFSVSPVSAKTYNYNPPPPTAAPSFTPPGGTYITPQFVTLAAATPGAAIHFTTDGSTPTTASPSYSAPISVSTTETIKALATASGYSSSVVATATFTITPAAATPTFSVPQGTYTTVQSVAILDATPNAVIYYTTDSTPPTAGSAVYSGPISVASTETLNAAATASGYSLSPVASTTYAINLPPPDFSVAAAPPALSLLAGQNGTFAVSVTPANGFNSAATFSCSGLPAGASCSFSPASVTPAGSAASTTLTIATSASSGAIHLNSGPFPSGVALAAILCCLSWKNRRRFPILVAISAIGLGLLTACGGGSGTTTPPPHQPTTSTITVTATAGGVQHSTTISLTVN